MIQDRAQKAQALKYIVSKRWFPQLEVNVLPKVAMAPANKPLTDIDLLALIPDEFDGFRLLIIDCKTRKGESPISRALWQRGLMDQLNATRGICIFKRNRIESDHRYSAAQFGVLLLTEDEFETYTKATGDQRNPITGHVANIDLWQKFIEIPLKYPMLTPAVQYSIVGHWMNRDDSEACRKSLTQASRFSRELDPAKATHMAVVTDLISLFMQSLAKIVARVFASYLQPSNRVELSEALLILLYGGREAYDRLNKLQRLIRPSDQDAQSHRELTLPNWDQFLQLVRHCLDAPAEVSKSPLLVRELAWSYLSGGDNLDFAKVLAAESPQAAKLSLLGAEYLCRATKLPPEFGANISRVLLDIQQPPY
jgi:hypothetical protein